MCESSNCASQASLAKVIKYELIGFKVRDKMLYASTRATLTKELGDYRFVESMYGSTTVSLLVDEHFLIRIYSGLKIMVSRLLWGVYFLHLSF